MPSISANSDSDNRMEEFHRQLELSLQESSLLMWRQADISCDNSRQGCRAYHKVWQTLRLLGVNTSITSDSEFLINSLRPWLRSGEVRSILLCGAADYGMLAHLLWAARLENVEPEITVIDRCETPLFINRWYADRQGARIASFKHNILHAWPETAGQFDLVCTHNLLGFYDAAQRGEIFDRWYGLLAPEGRLLTVVRLRPDATSVERIPSEAQAAAMAERALSALATRPVPQAYTKAEFREQVYEFIIKSTGYVIRSQGEIEGALGEHGFIVYGAEQHWAPNPIRSYGQTDSAPETVNRLLLRIIARKRDSGNNRE